MKLANKPQIIKLARDLRISPGEDAARSIIAFCLRAIRRIKREYPCTTLEELLQTAAARLDTTFREIHNDQDLLAIKQEFLARSELGFAKLEHELNAKVLAITFKLLNPRPWDRKYLSVIDCRGEKAARSYFSKWHELAHLFTQTDQMRFVFMRTHTTLDIVDPEEALMEQIAGAIGFLPELIHSNIQSHLSFDEVERLRMTLCPSASQQAAFIGVIKAWPTPCLYAEARRALRKEEERLQRTQRSFTFRIVPQGDLRAVLVVSNEEAVSVGLHIHQNMRVPADSLIANIFRGAAESGDAIEHLNTWRSSDGTVLPNLRVKVQAKRAWDDMVRVLMQPA